MVAKNTEIYYKYFTMSKQFRELSPVELWSRTLVLGPHATSLEKTVAQLSFTINQSFSGYMTRLPNGDTPKSFTRTRYPRRKYGQLSDTELNMSTATLKHNLKDARIINDKARYEDMFRVALGLVEGYGDGAPTHSLDDVRDLLAGTSLRAVSAEIFSVRPHESAEKAIYTEPVAIISGDPSDLAVVYDLADAFKQERFTVEDFSTDKAWVVETLYCTSPDPE